jgi:hypothetical protein
MRPLLFVSIVLLSMVTSLAVAGDFPEDVATWVQHWGDTNTAEPATLEPIPESSPTLIHPYFAEKYLTDDAWAAWAIAHNRAQGLGSDSYTDQLIQGRTTQIQRESNQTTITTTPNRYRRVYTGKPLIIYNPYAKQTNQ